MSIQLAYQSSVKPHEVREHRILKHKKHTGRDLLDKSTAYILF